MRSRRAEARKHTRLEKISAVMLRCAAFATVASAAYLPSAPLGRPAPATASRVGRVAMDGEADLDFGLSPGQKYGPTSPAHPMEKPWTNLETQEDVQLVKARSQELRQPLKDDMANDEIFVSKDSIHILKHHGSYMQQNRDLKKKADREQSYQFMLRLKVPVGEIPPNVFRELDDLSNKYGQGDLRATTRQAFQLHGVLKANLKQVIADIANVGSNTYGGCGDINRNIMAPAVHFPNNPQYVACLKVRPSATRLLQSPRARLASPMRALLAPCAPCSPPCAPCSRHAECRVVDGRVSV